MKRLRLPSSLLAGAAGLLSLTAAACATTQDPRDNVADDLETPPYRTLSVDERFELRRYEAVIVAATEVRGDQDAATREGFRRLADYIFGNNREQAEVAMTAPVATRAAEDGAGEGTAIAMTAPVATTATEGGSDNTSTWEVTFTMPSKWRLDTLPRPVDERVTLKERAARCQAAIVFSGFTTTGKVEDQERLLRAWLKERGLTATGAATLARYNAPFTLPWNRRNEVLIDVEGDGCLAEPATAGGPATL